MLSKKNTTRYLCYCFIILLVLLCIKNNWKIFSTTDEISTTESDYSETAEPDNTSNDDQITEISLRTFDPDLSEILDAMGLLFNAESGYVLNAGPTRLEGIVMMIKLSGMETEIIDEDNVQSLFKDVPLWAANYINYAYLNKLADSESGTIFGADKPLSLNEYMIYILRVLGYDDLKGDFLLSEAYVKGEELGLISEEEINTIAEDVFSRGDMVKITYNALSLTLKDQTIELKETLLDDRRSRSEDGGSSVLVQEFADENTDDYTTAIVEAQEYLSSVGGGTLVFEEGDYLIRPNDIFIPSNIKWLGEDAARLYTEESHLYNVLVSTEPAAENIYIKNIIFDQMGDDKLVPDVSSNKGCFIIHVNNTDNVTIENCTFYTYGVCAILSQSSYNYQTNNIAIRNNKAYFQRKTNEFYDVSVFNIDGRNVVVENNYIVSLNAENMEYWKARTAYEVHMPDGSVVNNISVNTEVGILHVAWPSLWDTYEPDFEGAVNIEGNSIKGSIAGISLWGASTLPGIATRNMSITDNFIGLYISDEYMPSQGIAITDGSIGNSEFENILISGNKIVVTASDKINDINKVMDMLVPGKDVGAICFNTDNHIKGLVISDNIVYGFPFAFLNLYKRNDDGMTQFHEDILVTDNTIIDSGFVLTSDRTFEGLFNLGNCYNIEISKNTIKKNTREPVYLLNVSDYLEGFTFTQNDYSTLTNGVDFQYTDFDVFINQVYDITFLSDPGFFSTDVDQKDLTDIVTGIWIDSRTIEVAGSSGILPGDMIFTPNNQAVAVTKVNDKYLSVLNDMTEWPGSKYLKRRINDE
jgi:hypothetical protein